MFYCEIESEIEIPFINATDINLRSEKGREFAVLSPFSHFLERVVSCVCGVEPDSSAFAEEADYFAFGGAHTLEERLT